MATEKGLQKQSFFFDQKKADKAIRYIETFCHHSEGRSDTIKLELWQKAFVSVVFGIMDGIGNRVIALKNCEIVNYDIFEALNMPKTFDEETYLLANMISS